MDKAFTGYLIEDRSYLAYVKREIRNQVAQTHFNRGKAGEIDIIVSELTSNLVKHAGIGEILFRTENSGSNAICEIITIDNGPGMSDSNKMMIDGMTTTKTLGHGLGAIQRLSDVFQLFSVRKWGTVAYSKVVLEKEKEDDAAMDKLKVRAILVPKPKEIFCGDGYATKTNAEEIRIFFGDGLGHGQYAFEAVQRAREFFLQSVENDPVEVIQGMHKHVRKTRGLVATVAIFDFKASQWRICGVGNITTRIYLGVTFKNYSSYNGIVGLNIPRSMKETIVEGEKNQYIIMSSDGLKTRWDLHKYPSVLKYDATILAAAIYKDFVRRTDDAAVLIGKVTI